MKLRLNINGNTVYGEKEIVTMLRRLDESQARLYFTAAQENGLVSFELNGQTYTLHRQSDYTYEVTRGQAEEGMFA